MIMFSEHESAFKRKQWYADEHCHAEMRFSRGYSQIVAPALSGKFWNFSGQIHEGYGHTPIAFGLGHRHLGRIFNLCDLYIFDLCDIYLHVSLWGLSWCRQLLNMVVPA